MYYPLLTKSVLFIVFFFFFKQKTAYEMRISDWSSDVCSSDLHEIGKAPGRLRHDRQGHSSGLPVNRDHARERQPDFFGMAFSSLEIANLSRCQGMAFPVGTVALAALVADRAIERMIDEQRSEERRVGEGCVSTGRYRWG